MDSRLFLMLPVALLLAGPAMANPLPAYGTFINVQAVQADMCTNCPITQCEDIVQYTELSGVLEFDIFVVTDFIGEPIYSLETTVSWPESWTLLDWEICSDGDGSVEPAGNQAAVSITWEHCPLLAEQPFLAARLVVNVDGEGVMSYEGDPLIGAGCPPNAYDEWAYPAEAYAGVVCSYCWTDCGYESVCGTRITPDVLYFEVPEGQTAEAALDAIVFGGDEWFPCPVSFDCTEDWMTVDDEWLSYYEVDLTLTIDTTGLEIGF